MSEPLYEIKNLKHRYGRGPLTLDLDFLSIKRGGICGLVGANGSGKSTLLKILAFLEPNFDGELSFCGAASRGREPFLRRQVTYLLQNPYLLKRTVYENIAYGLRLRGVTSDLDERVRDSLRMVGLAPESFAPRMWHRLSGGEVQRVALASRLALRTKVLLLDEPTANVDEHSAELVKSAVLSAWRDFGTTVVVATHDREWLNDISTDAIALNYGRIVK